MTEHASSRQYPWHCVLYDEVPGPDGWRVWCIPHGPLGAYQDPVAAFLAALEHDAVYGGDTWK